MKSQVFDTLLEPVFVINRESLIVYCNETAALLCESTPRRLTRAKTKLGAQLEFSSPVDWFTHLDEIREPTAYRELHFKNAHGLEGKAQITLQPIDFEDLNETVWILFFRDVTLEERLQKKYRAELEQKETYIDELKAARHQLEIYSKNLEVLVEERTREIVELNLLMKALLDSLNQGFFMFNAEGLCLPVFSKACVEMLDGSPQGRYVWDLLCQTPQQTESLKKWMFTLFSEMLPFEDLAPLGPNHRPHSQGKEISIEYFPLRDKEQKIQAVVCVATDITDLVQARRTAQADRDRVDSILKMIHSRRQLKLFFSESAKDFPLFLTEIKKQPAKIDYDWALRMLHTFKGGAASFSYSNLKNLTHTCEENLIKLKEIQSEPLRALIEDEIINLSAQFKEKVSEFEGLFGGNSLSDNNSINVSTVDLKSLLDKCSDSKYAQNLEENYLFEEISDHVSHYNQVAVSTAQLLNKEMAPIIHRGINIRVPKGRFTSLFQVLVHAIRNSVDHGIEKTEQRSFLKKPNQGKIELNYQIIGQGPKRELMIKMRDDGQGIDPQKIRLKLKKINSPLAQQNDAEIIYRIFDPGFSTREEITDISGRGVGMNAILEEVKILGGHIELATELNCFTEITITVPLLASVVDLNKKNVA